MLFKKKDPPLESLKRGFLHRIGIAKPVVCSYFMTYRCNFSCVYCPLGSDTDSEMTEFKRKTSEELSTTDAKHAIDQVRKVGTSNMIFSGGEPLLRDDLEEIAAHAKERGMKNILTTNGYLLNKKRARSISKCFDEVQFSIAGMRETNDELRKKGSFKKLKKNIGNITKIPKGLNFLINKLNLGEVEEVVNFAKKNCDYIYFWFVHYANEFVPSPEESDDVQGRLLKIKRENKEFVLNSEGRLKLVADFFKGKKKPIDCHPFYHYLTLWPDGSLSGCCYPHSSGNILEEDIEDIYSRKEAEIKKLKKICDGCFFG